MTARPTRPILIVLLTALIAAVLVGVWWFRGSAPQPMTVAHIDRTALAASDPIGQWWTSRDVQPTMPSAAHESILLDAVVFPRLSPKTSDVWAQMRRTEALQIGSLPESTQAPRIGGELRTELQTLTADFARMTAAYDLINARHYRAAIDDWWAPYPQSQVFPTLAGGYRETLLAKLPREEITPTHLQMGEVMAQRQRRLGWAAQAEVDAVAIALRERLDAERAVFESDLNAELTTRLASIELESFMGSASPNILPSTILSSGGSLPPLTLSTQFTDILAVHAAQMPPVASRDLMTIAGEETTAMRSLWDSYVELRDRRISAALLGQRLTEGDGPDMTEQVSGQLYPPLNIPTPIESATPPTTEEAAP